MGSLGAYVDEESGEEKEYESISAMFNEIVAHRIGMLPIPTDEKTQRHLVKALVMIQNNLISCIHYINKVHVLFILEI